MKKLICICLLLLASSAHAVDWRSVLMSDNAASTGGITYIGGSYQYQSGGAMTVILPQPTGVVEGNVIILGSQINVASITTTWPSGFTEIAAIDSIIQTQRIAYKVATASEPSTYTITLNGTGYPHIAGAILAYSGTNTTTPIEAYTATYYGTSDGFITNHTTVGVGVTSGTANRKLVMISGAIANAVWAMYTPPSGYATEFYNLHLSIELMFCISDYTDSPGTNTSNATATNTLVSADDALRWAFLLALKPL